MTVINDGGLGLVYSDGHSRTEFQPHEYHPVLSLEVAVADFFVDS